MFGKIDMNEGMILENVVAQMLVAQGRQLFFYSRSSKEDYHKNIEIDFLIRDKKKICPVEVKSASYRKHTSLDRFSDSFSSKIGEKYIVSTKDLAKDKDILCIPAYMAIFL